MAAPLEKETAGRNALLQTPSGVSEAVPIGDGMQIGEENFLPGKEETRRNPDGFQEFLTQPDEKFSVKMRAGAYWYSF